MYVQVYIKFMRFVPEPILYKIYTSDASITQFQQKPLSYVFIVAHCIFIADFDLNS